LGQVFPIWFIGCVTFWALTGEKEYRFLNQFRALPYFQTTWVRGRSVVKWEITSLLPKKQRHGSQTLPGFKSLGKLTPIEDFSDLVCYGQMELQDLEVGFYLFEDRKKQLQFVFRWFVEGPHAEISEREAQIILDKWNTGLRELLPGETVTFEQESLAEDKPAQAFLDQQLRTTDNALLKALTVSQKVRLRQLRDQGKRRVQRTLITATYTPDAFSHEKQDLIAKAILWLSRAWENFQGQREQLDYERLQKLVGFAFREGFLRWHSIFTSLMGLEARPLTSLELWQRDYAEFHQDEAPSLPQRLILNEKGLQMEADDPHLHAATVLFQGERGASTVPVNHPEWVYLPAHRQYVGLMQLECLVTSNNIAICSKRSS
jgi:hypothetical protein